MPSTAPQAPEKGYPGRDQLDAANAKMRRALARLAKQARRQDPARLADVERLAVEAAAAMDRATKQATQAVHESMAQHAMGGRVGRELARLLAQQEATGE